MSDHPFKRQDPVHRFLDACLYTTIVVGVGYWMYAFYQALGG
jgi:hypothetical protein